MHRRSRDSRAMVMTLILARHGQTAWNREERFRGHTDLPLDETGRRQAEALADCVTPVGAHSSAPYQPAAVYTSPLQRATATAAPTAARLNLETQLTPGLLDIDFGRFSGLSPREAEAAYPQVQRAWMEAPHTVCFPGGESLSDVRARAAGFLWEAVSRHGDQQVLMVSHLVVCRTLFCYLLGLPESHYWRFQLDTASVSVFAITGGVATLLLANDTSHLRNL